MYFLSTLGDDMATQIETRSWSPDVSTGWSETKLRAVSPKGAYGATKDNKIVS